MRRAVSLQWELNATGKGAANELHNLACREKIRAERDEERLKDFMEVTSSYVSARKKNDFVKNGSVSTK